MGPTNRDSELREVSHQPNSLGAWAGVGPPGGISVIPKRRRTSRLLAAVSSAEQGETISRYSIVPGGRRCSQVSITNAVSEWAECTASRA